MPQQFRSMTLNLLEQTLAKQSTTQFASPIRMRMQIQIGKPNMKKYGLFLIYNKIQEHRINSNYQLAHALARSSNKIGFSFSLSLFLSESETLTRCIKMADICMWCTAFRFQFQADDVFFFSHPNSNSNPNLNANSNLNPISDCESKVHR